MVAEWLIRSAPQDHGFRVDRIGASIYSAPSLSMALVIAELDDPGERSSMLRWEPQLHGADILFDDDVVGYEGERLLYIVEPMPTPYQDRDEGGINGSVAAWRRWADENEKEEAT